MVLLNCKAVMVQGSSVLRDMVALTLFLDHTHGMYDISCSVNVISLSLSLLAIVLTGLTYHHIPHIIS